MIKKLKKVTIGLTLIAVVNAVPFTAQAATRTKQYNNAKGGRDVVTMTTYKTASRRQKIDTPGFEKTNYTTGSIMVSKSQSFTFTVSETINASFKTKFVSIGASVGVAASASKTLSAGTTISCSEKAPNGVYYAYMVEDQYEVDFDVKSCSLNYTNWSTKYEKSFKYAPKTSAPYISLRRA